MVTNRLHIYMASLSLIIWWIMKLDSHDYYLCSPNLPTFLAAVVIFICFILYKAFFKHHHIHMEKFFPYFNIIHYCKDCAKYSTPNVMQVKPKPEVILFNEEDMINRSDRFYCEMNRRRTCRFFSRDNVPFKVIENIIKTAGTAPGISFEEPWTFVVVSRPETKFEIRRIVEEDEEINYKHRMGDKWVKDLKKLRTTWIKPYLEDAPYLIVILKHVYTKDQLGRQIDHHNNELSAGIASGFLLAALHKAGLATVTSTPLNIGPTLRALLKRPDTEKVILLLAVGYPSETCTVPDFRRKDLSQIMYLYE